MSLVDFPMSDEELDLYRQSDVAVELAQQHLSGETLNHSMRVMYSLQRFTGHARTKRLETVAALHDVLEDSECTEDDLRDAGIDLENRMAVLAITRKKDEPYETYLQRVKGNGLARIVKLADLKDNMDLDRLAQLPEDRALSLSSRYVKAYRLLTS